MKGRALEQLLDEFVDREAELARFREVLDADGAGIMVICGDSGVGKSTLLRRMKHEIAQRDLRKTEIEWTDSRNHDYLAVMRKIRDDLGVEHFQSFTDLVNYFTVAHYDLKITVEGGGIVVAEKARIEGARVGDIAGILVKDFMISDPRPDMRVSDSERMSRLTDGFLNCFTAAVGNRPCIALLDAVEKMSDETHRWVWNEFLTAVRDERVGPVKVVLCGRRQPDLDRSWKFVADIARLVPLGREHVVNYLAKRGVAPTGREQLADMLLVATQGNMLQLATYVDGYLKLQARPQAVP